MVPQLSIILPVYNVEKYLPRCLDSILKQTFKDFELIIINDGSTDNSLEVCEYYRTLDKRITVISQENQGLSFSRNYGISLSSAEYITFVDSDDYIDNIMYESMIHTIKDTDADIVVCGHRIVGEDNKIISDQRYDYCELSGLQATLTILDDKKLPSFAWDKVYRRSLFDDIRYPVGRFYEDIATTYLLFHKSRKVAIMDQVYYNYLRRPGSICLNSDSHYYHKRTIDLYYAFAERFDFAKKNNMYKIVLPTCAHMALHAGINLLHLSLRKPYIKLLDDCYADVRLSILDAFAHVNGTTRAIHRIEIYILKYIPLLYKSLMRCIFAIKYSRV